MRVDTITVTVEVVWRDERKGRATVEDMAAVHGLLTRYGLPAVIGLPPFATENSDFVLRCTATDFPCTVTIERKPQGPLQEAAWAFAEESGMARIAMEEGELGVLFLDENQFVPFSHLTHDPQKGFQIVGNTQ